MESGGRTSDAKRVDVDMDNSELSASTASNTMLPHLEATDAERALNENERRKRREARNKKEEEEKATSASSSISSSSEDRDDDESYQVSKGNKKEKKGKGEADNNKYAAVSFNYSSMPMTNHDRRSFINMPMGKLPHFDGTNFAK